MNTTLKNPQFPESLNRCGSSLPSFSSMSFSTGMAVLSICLALLSSRALIGRWHSSKLATGLAFNIAGFRDYFFFWASATSSILRMASSRLIGLEFLRSPCTASLGSRFWANPFGGVFIGFTEQRRSYFLGFLAACFLRKSTISLFGIRSAGRARISSQDISGMDLVLCEFWLVVVFPDLRLMVCNDYSINN